MTNFKELFGICSDKFVISTARGKKIIIEDIMKGDDQFLENPVTFNGSTYSSDQIWSSFVCAYLPSIDENYDIDTKNIGLAQYTVFENADGSKNVFVRTTDKSQPLVITKEIVKFIESEFSNDKISGIELMIAGAQDLHHEFASMGYNENLQKPGVATHNFDTNLELLFMQLSNESDSAPKMINQSIAFRNGYPDLAPSIIPCIEEESQK